MYHSIYYIFIAAVFLSACKSSADQRPEKQTAPVQEVQQFTPISITDSTLIKTPFQLVSDSFFKDSIQADLLRFYTVNDFKTFWLFEEKSSPKYYAYLEALKAIKTIGLNEVSYACNILQKKQEALYIAKPKNEDIIKLDKEITASFLLLLKHLNDGRLHNLNFDKKFWIKYKNTSDEVDLLLNIKDSISVHQIIDQVQPKSKFYADLVKRLTELNNTNKDELTVFEFNDTKAFKLGYENVNLLAMRLNLQRLGYNIAIDSNRLAVDSALFKTIMKFQEDRGLQADGIPGKQTMRYLTRNQAEERELISLNLERLRWLQNDFGNQFVWVNIPDFNFYYYKNDTLALKSKVIVGKTKNATVIFSDEIEYMDFRPTWTVPQSIIKNEFIPKLVNNPSYYTNRGFRITEAGNPINVDSIDWSSTSVFNRTFKFVEKPSGRNSLGLVKFIFPNKMNIYLHDTPTKYLFAREKRAMSHGCVRVEKPAEFAYELLIENMEPWTMTQVNDSMRIGNSPKRVLLDKKIPIHIVYITAFINEKGILVTPSDVYGHDKRQLKQLEQFK